MEQGSVRRVWRPLLAVLLVALVLGPAPGVRASLHSKIKDARTRLETLGRRISREERAVARVESRLATLHREIDRVSRQLTSIEEQVRAVQEEVDEVEVRLSAYQAELGQLARAAYISQPGAEGGTFLTLLLGSQSISDIYDGLEFSASAAEPIITVVHRIQIAKAELDAKLASRQALESQKLALLQRAQARRRERHQAAVQDHRALRSLKRTRGKIIDLARKLLMRWHLRMFPLVGTAFPGPGHTSFGRWSVLFLRALDAPACHSNEAVIVAWQLTEFTQAAWNPLATTTRMTGSSDFNDAGVQNFVSLEQGLDATKLTLYNGAPGYDAILGDLHACAPAMTTAQAIRDSAWCHDCSNGHYVTANIAAVLADFTLYAAF